MHRRDPEEYFYQDSQMKEYHLDAPFGKRLWLSVADNAFNLAHSMTDAIAKEHPL